MKLAIIDPGYTHAHAHHQMVNFAIHRALSEKGVDVMVLASKELDQSAKQDAQKAGAAVTSYFTTPCYPPNADSLPKAQHDVLARAFTHELITLFKTGLLQGDENLLLHTGYSFHIAGLARALWHLQGCITGRILVSMMFHPGARLQTNKSNNIEFFDTREYLRHKQALHLLQAAGAHSGTEISLATPCRAYQRIYQTLWPAGRVQVHPAVGYQALPAKAPTKSPSKPRVLLYLGGPKDDKGIKFAARLGTAAAKAFPQTDFIFHFNNNFPGAERFTPLVNELQRAGEERHNVEILTGNLSAKHYDALLLSSNIMCVLYDPAHYSFKTSGVFWDALRCINIGWLVTEKTWPADELAELRIPNATIAYDDVQTGLTKLGELLHQHGKNAGNGQHALSVDLAYMQQINSSFGSWLYGQFNSKAFNRISSSATKTSLDYQANRGKILVVRTHYGHFSPLSGPGGFIPHLRGLGYTVDEILVPLGAELLKNTPAELQQDITQITQRYLQSYQGNAVAIETEIQREAHRYDIVHFLDAEHCGLLSALYNQQSSLPQTTQFIATYHQPKSIMQQIVTNPDYLNGFNRIHMMSPCQGEFFKPLVDADRLCVAPHGLAPELLDESLPPLIIGLHADSIIPGFDDIVCGRKILLTVGNWLRDFDSLLQTAKRLAAREDLIFVVVSKGLSLDAQHMPNVLVLNQGITDAQLHALYLQATLLFLPLQDGAANNAILEAMAHGLPIVTTDLPSTHYYTKGLAVHSSAEAPAYAAVLENMLTKLAIPDHCKEIRDSLQQRARELTWEHVATTMHETLYAPLLTKAKRQTHEIRHSHPLLSV